MRGLASLDTDFSYVVCLDEIALPADESPRVWMPLVIAGEWNNPRHGEILITKADVARMHHNFKAALHPLTNVELAFDYEHLSTKPDRRPGDGVAAAWVKDLQLRAGGMELWGLVEYTKEAAEKIRAKAYRYFSPVFTPNGRSLRGGQEIGPTLLGGALTNFPTLPLPALTLSSEEGLAVRKSKTQSGAPNMKTIKLKQADGSEVEIALDSLAGVDVKELASVHTGVADLQRKVPGPDAKIVSAAEFNEMQGNVTTLSATVESLKLETEKYKTKADESDKKLLSAEIDALMKEGRILPAEKDLMIEMAATARPMFDKMITARKAAPPLIKLDTTHGEDHSNDADPNSSVVKFDALVEDVKTKNPKMTFVQAIQEAAKKDPALARARNKELGKPMNIRSDVGQIQ